MSPSNHIPELVESFYAPFEAKLESSPSMIFSGKFGSGKTYFLNNYFEDKKDKYCLVYTQPSAYYHAADNDPLSYLKYDILMDLLRQTDVGKLKGVQLTYFDMLQAMLIPSNENEDRDTSITIIGAAVMLLFLATGGAELGAEKMMGMVTSTWESSETLKKGLTWLKGKKKEANEDDETRLEEHLKVLGNKKNSLFETTAINELIKALLKQQRNHTLIVKGNANVAPRKTVLVVDDLDRMLPDAALSFLNMLSTHVYPTNQPPAFARSGNMYAFDKIVVCGDIKNIRSFIYLRYGSTFDANGYMAKILGPGIIQYDPALRLSRIAVEQFADPLVNELSHLEHTRDHFKTHHYDQIRGGLAPVVEVLILCDILTIRSLNHYLHFDYSWLVGGRDTLLYKFGGGKQYTVHKHTGVLIINFVLMTFAYDIEAAIDAFQSSGSKYSSINSLQHTHIASLLHLSTKVTDPIIRDTSGNITTDLSGYPLTIIIRDSPIHHTTQTIVTMEKEDAERAVLEIGISALFLNVLTNITQLPEYYYKY